MLGPPKVRRRDERALTSLERRLPASNFYCHLDAKLDLSFVRDWVGDKYAERGRPSIDPVVFFRLKLIMFFEGLHSERTLMETADLHVGHRWYLGDGFDESLPDHWSLTRMRTRLGLASFTRFFQKVVELCQEAGLVWGKELLVDATKVRANADIDSLTPRFARKAKDHLDDLFAGDPPVPGESNQAPTPAAETDVAPEPLHAKPAPELATAVSPERMAEPVLLPFAGTPEEEQQLAAENQAHWRLLDEHRLDPDPPAAHGYQRTTDLRVSTADPDATPMSKGDAALLGYHDHDVVVGGRARIILCAFVTPSDVMDNRPMRAVLRRVRFRYHLSPNRAVGDPTYGTAENITALEDAGTRAYVPLPNLTQRTGLYGADRFRYDVELDVCRFPNEVLLLPRQTSYTKGAVLYQAAAASCNACPLKAACTTSDRGRVVQRPLASAFLDRVRGYHATASYKKAMRKRQVWVEPLFGEWKQWRHLDKFQLRGLEKVNIEAQVIAAVQNVKRWLKATGWGRRTVPSAAALAVFSRLSAVLASYIYVYRLSFDY